LPEKEQLCHDWKRNTVGPVCRTFFVSLEKIKGNKLRGQEGITQEIIEPILPFSKRNM
jgi:hypothetical protein